jgi:hypothetical protein
MESIYTEDDSSNSPVENMMDGTLEEDTLLSGEIGNYDGLNDEDLGNLPFPWSLFQQAQTNNHTCDVTISHPYEINVHSSNSTSE